jgi:benzoyl-CoA reductase/2-hydroxyglutaryl-CoA dehydratase subunit BcrC/BadD/HgdB
MAEGPEIAATRALKDLMSARFRALDEAARDPERRVAWCSSVGPVELLTALGFEVYFPENHGALLGATRKANDYIPRAVAEGYSPDICSYLTSDVGACLAGETPLSRLYGLASVPKPDVLVYNTNQCRDVQDWFSFYGRRWNVPVLGVHTQRGVGEVSEAQVEAVEREIRALVQPLEKIAGRPLDSARLEEAVAESRQTSRLWQAVLETGASRPSALTFFDGAIHMGPAVIARGAAESNAYYRHLLEELAGRTRQGIGAVPGERLRLYWDGMPVWGRLRSLASLFRELRTCVVASTYCNSWVFEALDPNDPFRSMARSAVELFIVRSEEEKERALVSMARLYGVDGIIFHDARTCPNNSNSRYGMPGRLSRSHGIPTLTIQGDLNDLRLFSDEQSSTNIEAFVEQLEERIGSNV